MRVWGHGYVEAYFDEAGSQSVYLKRYRCPECRVVMRLRPSGYWKRIQAAVATVRQCLMDRLEKGRWPPGSNPAAPASLAARFETPGAHALGHELRGANRRRLCGACAPGRCARSAARFNLGRSQGFTHPTEAFSVGGSSSLGYTAGNNSQGGFPMNEETEKTGSDLPFRGDQRLCQPDTAGLGRARTAASGRSAPANGRSRSRHAPVFRRPRSALGFAPTRKAGSGSKRSIRTAAAIAARPVPWIKRPLWR